MRLRGKEKQSGDEQVEKEERGKMDVSWGGKEVEQTILMKGA